MANTKKRKSVGSLLIPMIIWQIFYLIGVKGVESSLRVYVDCVFYLVIVLYFYFQNEWSFKEWFVAISKGKSFWLAVGLTILGMVTMFVLGDLLASQFKGVDDGLGVFRTTDWPSLFAFVCTTILLPPIAEEVFYRKAMIKFDSKSMLWLSALFSIVFFASEHSMVWLGFLQAALWAIPLTIAMIKTKDVYVGMTAHFLCNLIINGWVVIQVATHFLT